MNTWKNRTLHFVLFVFVAAMVIASWIGEKLEKDDGYRRSINEGWNVKLNNGERYEDINLNSFHMDVCNAGTQIILTNTLPENLENNLVMLIYTVHSVVDVYIDDEKVYSHGREDFKIGKMIGYGTDFVSVPDDSAGKSIKIALYVTENNAFSTISAPVFYNEATAYRDYYSTRRIPLVVAISLIVVGLCISFVTFFTFFKSYSMDKLFCIGAFSLCIGFWSLSNYNVACVITSSMYIKTCLEFMSLYLLMLPLLFYFRADVEERRKRWELFVYYALIIFEIQIVVISAITNFTNVLHFPAYLRIYQVFLFVAGAFMVYLLIVNLYEKKTHKILIWGFIVILLVAIRDLVVFNYTKYNKNGGTEGEYRSYIAGAALIFVLSLFIDFIYEMRKHLYSSAQTDFYVKLAYYDVLTDLFTRRKCDEVFDELDKASDMEYTLVQYDLNNLKVTNDIYGHEEGDALIIRFANVLKETFNEGEILARMGGDEFIAIIPGNDPEHVKEKLKNMETLIAKTNSEYPKIKVSVSYGYATSGEQGIKEVRKLYKLADKRMYEQKENFYKTSGLNRRRSDVPRN